MLSLQIGFSHARNKNSQKVQADERGSFSASILFQTFNLPEELRSRYFFITLSLLISLFIYLFYRTEKTVVNDMLISLISFQTYARMKQDVMQLLPLNEVLIYSMPEGLWVFCITLTSKPYFIGWNSRRLHCLFLPLIYCISLEIFQLLHLTNGRFDLMDIQVSILFWLIANHFFKYEGEKQNILAPLNTKSLACFSSYAIVYLSHVLR
jgi:hypothetical protein